MSIGRSLGSQIPAMQLRQLRLSFDAASLGSQIRVDDLNAQGLPS